MITTLRTAALAASAIAALAIFCGDAQVNPGREWHVSTNGRSEASATLADPVDLATALDGRRVGPGDTVWLHGGRYIGRFDSRLQGTEANPIVVRQWPGERATLAGNVARGVGAVLNVFGAWTIYRDFGVTNISSNRGRGSDFRPMGIEVQAPHTKFINLIVYDTGIGFGVWDKAVAAELYGNIIYNSGSENTPSDKRHGHAIYAQNKDGTKYIRENILFNQFGFGMHIYSNVGLVKGFLIEGNVAFNNGIQNGPTVRYNNLLLLGHGRPYSAEDITVRENYTYDSREQAGGASFSDANASFGCNDPGANRNLVVQNNYFAGGLPVAIFCNWEQVVVTSNTIVGSAALVGLQARGGSLASYDWNRNSYTALPSWNGPRFGFNGAPIRSFDEWRDRTGLDQQSTLSTGVPRGSVFVRPNRYEPGRAHIIAYNWSGQSAIEVDLSSVLRPGARFELRNAEDFFGPPEYEGTYEGRPITLPVSGRAVQPAIGMSRAVRSVAPEFNVYVLLPSPQSGGRSARASAASKRGRPEPPIDDVAKYVGVYHSAQATAEVSVRDGGLEMTIASEKGEPVFVLEPVSPGRFRMSGAPAGFFVTFDMASGKASSITVVRGSHSPVTLEKRR